MKYLFVIGMLGLSACCNERPEDKKDAQFLQDVCYFSAAIEARRNPNISDDEFVRSEAAAYIRRLYRQNGHIPPADTELIEWLHSAKQVSWHK